MARCTDLEKAWASSRWMSIMGRLTISCCQVRPRDAWTSRKSPPRCASDTACTLRPEPVDGAAPDRSRGPNSLQVNWPSVANGRSGDDRLGHARSQLRPVEEFTLSNWTEACPRYSTTWTTRVVKHFLGCSIGEFGRSPRLGVSTSGNSILPRARFTGRIATAPW